MNNDLINTAAPVNPRMHSGIITVAYVLFGIGLLTVYTTAILGLILAYLKRDDVQGTYLTSHCDGLIQVFWWGLLWNLVGWATFLIGIGFVVWGVVWVWTAYKLLKGFLKLHAELAV
jgi:uncharacterized membrane protein